MKECRSSKIWAIYINVYLIIGIVLTITFLNGSILNRLRAEQEETDIKKYRELGSAQIGNLAKRIADTGSCTEEEIILLILSLSDNTRLIPLGSLPTGTVANFGQNETTVNTLSSEALFRLNNRAIPYLIVALDSKKYKHEQSQVVNILCKIADQKTHDSLLEYLKNLVKSNQSYGANMSFSCLGADAVPILIRALDSTNSDLKRIAAKDLGEIGDQRGFKPILNLLSNVSTKVSKERPKDRSYDIFVFRESLIPFAKLGKSKSYKFLSELFNKLYPCWDSITNDYFLLALSYTQDERALDILLHRWESGDSNTRLDVVRALANIEDHRSIDALISALNDEYFAVRMESVQALGKMKVVKAVEPLNNLILLEKDPDVKKSALEALDKINIVQ